MTGTDVLVGAVCDTSEAREGAMVSRGLLVYGPELVEAYLPAGAYPVDGWCDGQARLVWCDDPGLSVVTYCEGDVEVVVCESRAAYLDELTRQERYYRGVDPDGTFHGWR